MAAVHHARAVVCGACVLLAALTPLVRARPHSPIQLQLELVQLDPDKARAEIRIEVSSEQEAPETNVELIVPEGIGADQTSWTVDLVPGKPLSLYTTIRAERDAGNVAITARASKVFGPTDSWGDAASVLLRADPQTHRLTLGWVYTHVPVLRQVEPGNAKVVSTSALPIPEGPWSETLGPTAEVPVKGANTAAEPDSPGAALQFTVTGRFVYPDRSGVDRDAADILLELRRGDGEPLPGSNFCFTNGDGTFSCSFEHPGTTLRLRFYAYTNLDPGPTRLGVFSPSCGDAPGCAWPQDSWEFTCPAGTSCDLGVIGGTYTEPWMGAMQMTEDMIRAFEKLIFDNLHAPQNGPLPGRIVFPSAVGPQYTRGGNDDDWISIPYPYQMWADVIVHEYGHAVMRWLWMGFSPSWPSSDCPSPHDVKRVSGPGCAMSEGWADFWSWYGNEFYDGDNNPANDGGIYNESFTVDMENRTGSWDSGDRVEGNVAAVLGDLLDAANDGPTPGAADRVTDRIQHIWHVMSSRGYNNFREWYDEYLAEGHDPGPLISILERATIDYTPFDYNPEDVCPSAYTAQPTPWTKSIYVPGATTDSTDPTPPCGNGSRAGSVFYQFNSGGQGLLTIDTFGSYYDTILSVWKGSCGAMVPVAGGCNDDAGGGLASQVSFNTEPGVTYIIMVTSYNGYLDWLQINVNYSATPPIHDACPNAKVIPALIGPWGDADWTDGATWVASDPYPDCQWANPGPYNTVWYRFTAPYDGRLSFGTGGSSYDTVLSVYTAGCEPSLRQLVACNDDSASGVHSSLLLDVKKGVTYHIMVSSKYPGGGYEVFNSYFSPAAGRVDPLLVSKVPGSTTGDLQLSWNPGCLPYDSNYAVYEGTLGSWYSHSPRTCSTGNVYSTTLTPAPGSTYYLVSALSGYAEGSLGNRSSGAEIPGAACNYQNPGRCPPLCGHDPCYEGPGLDPGCGQCIADICAVDPFCCYGDWDAICVSEVRTVCDTARCPDTTGSCRHGLCEEGGSLVPGCDAVGCVSQICAVDPFCCDIFGWWDNICVSEVTSVCGYRCQESY